ncbi:PREDICTED: uncharacterized protein LOC107189205 isoform X2 [Dufourea novaeangliae]|uniref:uncharacterized protein LOC107189205 isoform X2 n=1 Tax=Dufourea novaeangliae TaxID=178035 RepID=UPI000767DA08|nr:PREDICTED: uncharacterized protein LOC107189205 isoform X2 [Dufourea novaeangliae]
MWIFYVALVVASSGCLFAFPQNDSPRSDSDVFQVDGFVFDGPATRPISGNERFTTVTESTSTSTTTTPAPSRERDACMSRCQVTPEYNPVCGSNNVAYNNPGLLSCAAICGEVVTLNYYGPCVTANTSG